MDLLNQSDDTTFAVRMPEVDEPAAIGAVFQEARAVASAGAPQPDGTVRRGVVIVTSQRKLILQRCPLPGSLPQEEVNAIQQMFSPERKRNIAAISYTDQSAVTTDVSRAMPFIGILLGLAYVGHAVWAFEGHASAMAYGCRNADVLLVDSGMLPYLTHGWQGLASRVMHTGDIYIQERAR